jgi:hypothetical protein
VIKGCNIFGGQKLANTCGFVGGRIIVQKEKNFERRTQSDQLVELASGDDPFLPYKIPLWYKLFMHYALRVEKNILTWSSCGTLGITVSSAKGISPTHSELCRFVSGSKAKRQVSSPVILQKKIICIGHRDNALVGCDSIFPLLRCQGVWNKTCTQLSLSQILFQNPKNYSLGEV